MALATISGIEPPNQDPSASSSSGPPLPHEIRQEVPKVRTKTTRPIMSPSSERAHIRTERLLIRPPLESDLDAIHALRTQPEVMQWTIAGCVDADVGVTREWMARFMPPVNDLKSFQFVILYTGEEQEGGTLIGTGSCMNAQGQPEIGYMFRKEFWGKGLATEFVRALTKAWWALPRKEVVVETDADLLLLPLPPAGGADDEKKGAEEETIVEIPEILIAVINAENQGSRKVLEKSSFREYKTWTEPDARPGYGGLINLVGFRMEAPTSAALS
ncbi:acetyltransferase domain-containing protein [Xylariaceae sp. FL0594]|nr:acetyltransferase domain-containing protein [Xylariaceae sp. FL0594]